MIYGSTVYYCDACSSFCGGRNAAQRKCGTQRLVPCCELCLCRIVVPDVGRTVPRDDPDRRIRRGNYGAVPIRHHAAWGGKAECACAPFPLVRNCRHSVGSSLRGG